MPADLSPQRTAAEEAMARVIAETRHKFIDRLIVFGMELERDLPVIGTDAAGLAAIERAGRTAHTIAGLAKTVGFDELGQMARVLDTEIAHILLLPPDRIPVAALQDALDTFIELLVDCTES